MRFRLLAALSLALMLSAIFPGSPSAIRGQPPVSLTLLSPPAGLELPVGQAVEVSCRVGGETQAIVEFLVNGVAVRTESVPPGGVATFSWMPTQTGRHALAVVAHTAGGDVLAATRHVLAVPPGSPVRIR